MEMENGVGGAELMGNLRENGEEENGVIQINTSGILEHPNAESQESNINLPILRGARNVLPTSALRDGKIEIPDSDAVSEFSSPVKIGTLHHHINAGSPPKGLTSDRIQLNGYASFDSRPAPEIVLPSFNSSFDGSNVVFNSSPPLLQQFISSPVVERIYVNGMSFAADLFEQVNGVVARQPSNSQGEDSSGFVDHTTVISQPSILTSTQEFEKLVTYDSRPVSTQDKPLDLEDKPSTNRFSLGEGDLLYSKAEAAGTTATAVELEEVIPVPANLPNEDSQHFDAAWREIMGTQKLPDSDITEATQATALDDHPRPKSQPAALEGGLLPAIMSSNDQIGHEPVSSESNKTSGDVQKWTADQSMAMFNANITVSQEAVPEKNIESLQTTEKSATIDASTVLPSPRVSNKEEAKRLDAKLSQEDCPSSMDLRSPTAIVVALVSQSEKQEKQLEVLPPQAMNTTRTAASTTTPDSPATIQTAETNYEMDTTASATEPDSTDSYKKSISNLNGSGLQQNPPTPMTLAKGIGSHSISTVARSEEIGSNEPRFVVIMEKEKTVTEPSLDQLEGTKTLSLVTTEQGINQFALGRATHNEDLDKANQDKIETELQLPSAIQISPLVSPVFNIALESRLPLTSDTALDSTTRNKLEILDSDDEMMSVDLMEQEEHKNTVLELPSNIRNSTPLFDEISPKTTVSSPTFKVEGEHVAQSIDVDMFGQDVDDQPCQHSMTSNTVKKSTNLATPRLEKAQMSRKRVIPDSDEDADDDESERQPVLPGTFQCYSATIPAASIEAPQASNFAPSNIRSTLEVNKPPVLPPQVEEALPPKQKKQRAKTSNKSFKLPKINKDTMNENGSLSSSPVKPEISTPSTSKQGETKEAVTPQGPGSNDLVIAELKAMKIASLKARNASLVAEIAAKRAKLDEVTKTLKHPAAETVKTHIKLLHDYNDIRDVGQGLIGMIADNRGVRIGELYEEFGVDLKD